MREVDEFLVHGDSYLTFHHTTILPVYPVRPGCAVDEQVEGHAGELFCVTVELASQAQQVKQSGSPGDLPKIQGQPTGQ